MTSTARTSSADDLGDRAEEVADHPATRRASRVGFAAKGFLHLVMAAIASSIGVTGGGQASQTGAISRLEDQPFGVALLAAMALGLGCYAVVRLLHVVTNPEGRSGVRGAADRLVDLVRGLAYGGLTAYTVKELVSSGGGGSGGERRLTQVLLELPLGSALVAAIAIGMVVAAVALAREGWTRSFMDDLHRCTGRARRTVEVLGLAGHAARAVVFAVIGVLFGQAALQSDPSEAGGVDAALDTISGTAGGSVLLLAVAAGLAAYGLWCLAVARWGDAHADG